MLALEVIAQSGLTPAASHAVDRRLLDLARVQTGRAWLRVYDLAGDVLALGRYHPAPASLSHPTVRLHRRLGGGRVMPSGPGFVALSLTMAHRSALVSADPFALRPEQVLNRCVRALLGGLRRVGVEAFYPGRDRITVDGRTVGLVSLESDVAGTTVFEAVLAVDGDWLRLPELVAALDRDGVIAAQVPSPDEVTTLREHAATPPLEALGEYVAAAYMQQFALEPVAGAPPTPPSDAEQLENVWLGSRRLRPGLDRHAIEWGQIGAVEVYLGARAELIDDIMLCGDFIADSASIARLEDSLRGVALTRAAVGAVVDTVYADRQSFLFGIGPTSTLVDTILRAK